MRCEQDWTFLLLTSIVFPALENKSCDYLDMEGMSVIFNKMVNNYRKKVNVDQKVTEMKIIF